VIIKIALLYSMQQLLLESAELHEKKTVIFRQVKGLILVFQSERPSSR
jgi:hypothetical protein